MNAISVSTSRSIEQRGGNIPRGPVNPNLQNRGWISLRQSSMIIDGATWLYMHRNIEQVLQRFSDC